jgi:hypothetical protein
MLLVTKVILARSSKFRGWGSSAPVSNHVYIAGVFVPTLRLPPVRVTFTKRRVYVSLFLARPLGVFFFSWGSTFACVSALRRRVRRVRRRAYLGSLRLDLSGTSEGSVNFTHDCGVGDLLSCWGWA